MPDKELSLGGLLTSYMEWDGLDGRDFEALAGWGFTEREQLLPAILAQLPKGTGITSFDELDAVLWDLVDSVDMMEDPWSIAARYCELLQPRKFVFHLPFAQTPSLAVDFAFGGRNDLALRTARVGPWNMAVLHGSVDVGHPIPAQRAALGLAEQVAGLLMALDVLRFAHNLEQEKARQAEPTPIGLRVGPVDAGEDEAEAWSIFTLPWREQYYAWGTAVCAPRDLTDLEKLAAERDGAAAGIRHRLELIHKVFSVGGMDAKRIRRAARFLRKASTAEEPGDSYLFLATALEGLLVEGEGELQKRVCDAASIVAGPTYSERTRARGLAEHLYKVRSRYIHTGEYEGAEEKRQEVIQLVRYILASEIRLFARSN